MPPAARPVSTLPACPYPFSSLLFSMLPLSVPCPSPSLPPALPLPALSLLCPPCRSSCLPCLPLPPPRIRCVSPPTSPLALGGRTEHDGAEDGDGAQGTCRRGVARAAGTRERGGEARQAGGAATIGQRRRHKADRRGRGGQKRTIMAAGHKQQRTQDGQEGRRRGSRCRGVLAGHRHCTHHRPGYVPMLMSSSAKGTMGSQSVS
jgi:hypothetical protein